MIIQNNNIHVNLTDLVVGYKLPNGEKQSILTGINLNAAAGEMVALIGSNGIGKSTLLRSITGFQEYFSGSIMIGGYELKDIPVRQIARIMSFVSTENIRVANMTVFDLVAYGRFPYTNWIGVISDSDRKWIMNSIASVGLLGFENRQVTQISDGERQRAMIARALAQDTPVIVLDEPTAYLDVSNKYEIFHLLQTLAKDNQKTVILSTHDLNIALREVDKLWIVTGDNNFQGAPEDAVLHGWLNQLFKNEHIGFDSQEGEFYFKKDFKSRVKVEGEGLMLTWTLRALNRTGYQIVIKAIPDFHIQVTDNCWKLKTKHSEYTFHSIYELLLELEKQHYR